jgi:PsbP
MGSRNRHHTACTPRPRLLVLPAAGLGVIMLLATACGASAPPKQAVQVTTPQHGVPSGYTQFRDSARGYSIALPSSWIQINVQSPQAGNLFARALKDDPKAAAALGGSLATMQKENMSLLAVAADGAGANMIVTTSAVESPSRAQIASLVPTFLSEYARVGMIVSAHEVVTVDGHPALRFQASITMKGRTVRETQFVVITGGWDYTLTTDQVGAPTVAEIVSTVRFSS